MNSQAIQALYTQQGRNSAYQPWIEKVEPNGAIVLSLSEISSSEVILQLALLPAVDGSGYDLEDVYRSPHAQHQEALAGMLCWLLENAIRDYGITVILNDHKPSYSSHFFLRVTSILRNNGLQIEVKLNNHTTVIHDQAELNALVDDWLTTKGSPAQTYIRRQ